MNRRNWILWIAASGLALVVAATAPAFPQTEEGTETGREDAVEKILQQQETQLGGAQFNYDPRARRDPFKNLFEDSIKGPDRQPGILGMRVDEIDLSGIVKDEKEGDVALVIGSDSKGYFMRLGDRCFDGTVISIDPRLGAVTFRQKVQDPRQIKPFRDVVKRLVALGTDGESR